MLLKALSIISVVGLVFDLIALFFAFSLDSNVIGFTKSIIIAT